MSSAASSSAVSTPTTPADPAAFRAALDAAGFVVSLELRETDVTRVADVVLPVPPVTDKAGTFVTWEGRTRSFEAVFTNPASLPDLRVLAGIADELVRAGPGSTAGLPHRVAEVRAEMEAMGPWDGARPALDAGKAPRPAKAARKSSKDGHAMTLADLEAARRPRVDAGRRGAPAGHRASPGRPPQPDVVRRGVRDAGRRRPAAAGQVTVTGDRGTVTLPVEVADLPDDVVWVPARSFGRGVLAELASPGSPVTVKSGIEEVTT